MNYLKNSSVSKANVLSVRGTIGSVVLAGAYVLKLSPEAVCIAGQGDRSECRFSSEEREELLEHCRSYNNDIFVMEHEGAIWLFASGLYPASGAVPAFKLAVSAGGALRALKDTEACSLSYSERILTKPSRMRAEIEAYKEELEWLLRAVKPTLLCMGLDMKELSGEQRHRELISQCFQLSRFCGCVIELEAEDGFGEKDFYYTDYPLFTAFVYTFLLLIGERRVRLSVDTLSEAAIFRLCFGGERVILADDAFIFWEHLAYENNMLFDASEENSVITLNFHPCRQELSYLGLKQSPVIRRGKKA